VHRSGRDAAHGSFDLFGQFDGSGNGDLDGALARFNSPFVARDDADFVGRQPFGDTVGEPFSDRYRLSIGIGEGLDDGFDAIEAEIVPLRPSALLSTSASAGCYATLRKCDNQDLLTRGTSAI
jgi:hypothetical protein